MTGINSSSPTFEAVIDMAKPDGSAAHEHEIITYRFQNNQTIKIIQRK
ncbi:hypothetical protein [Candidatus Nitrosocosmicus sp. SS]|nr:hypothetical protein [Candidatus Nitrosocosmicus sp. SS]MDR4490477.1 hypothetical protein [Candidatus Nitrosocosmicus sp.]